MVFQKRGDVKGKQQQAFKPKGRKAPQEENDFDMVVDDSDSDDDDSGSDGQAVIKTPTNKALKGKQPASDKKVSFQIPGKNTPAKTPKNENSVLVKKPTPAKGLKEFEGLLARNTPKKNGNLKRPAQDDDDDDDDDEDDDDDDDDDEDDVDLEKMLGGDDDDDDEDDDDDDDEDDDDDDDEQVISSKKNIKQQLNQSKNSIKNESVKTPLKSAEKTPLKNAEKTPARNSEKTPKKVDKSPAKDAAETPKVSTSPKKTPGKKSDIAGAPALQKALEIEAERRRERDLRTLYLGNLPKDVTQTELKAWCSDIVNAVIPRSAGLKKRKNSYAFLEFKSEAKAEENFKILGKKKLRNEQITLDFAGEKSKNRQNTPSGSSDSVQLPGDLKRLYVSLPKEATIDKVAKFFPKAFQITLHTSSSYRSAIVNFMDESDAAEALEASKSAKICEEPLNVLYARSGGKKVKRKKQKSSRNPPAKKMKVEIKQESDDDDEDDDDDDDSDE